MVDLTDVFVAVIGLITAIISTFLIPYIKNKINSQNFDEAKKFIKIAVEAAEMIFKESGSGAKKKEYVEYLVADKGFNYDSTTINALIESSVCQLNEEICQ